MNTWIAAGALSGGISVICGAFGAHALADRLEPKALAIWQTAAQYQLTHSIALIAFALWATQAAPEFTDSRWPGYAFAGGIFIFSGTLYTLALTDIRWLGAITPIGGVLLISGWLGWAYQAWAK